MFNLRLHTVYYYAYTIMHITMFINSGLLTM